MLGSDNFKAVSQLGVQISNPSILAWCDQWQKSKDSHSTEHLEIPLCWGTDQNISLAVHNHTEPKNGVSGWQPGHSCHGSYQRWENPPINFTIFFPDQAIITDFEIRKVTESITSLYVFLLQSQRTGFPSFWTNKTLKQSVMRNCYTAQPCKTGLLVK